MVTIESNFESICINPNDDLVLYKKEIVRSRIEKFLYAICSLDTDDLPTPLSRIEELYNCLVTGEDIPTFTPLSRAEKFVMAMLGAYDVELLPTPNSRSEILMKKIATGDNNLDDVDNLQSRYEFLLAYIIKAGGFNGGSGDFYYNLTSLTSGFTTIYNTLDMPVKNAVLRGQTLVNIAQQYSKFGTYTGYINFDGEFFSYTKPATVTSGLTFKSIYGNFEIGKQISIYVNNQSDVSLYLYNSSYGIKGTFEKGVSSVLFTTDSDSIRIGLLNNSIEANIKVSVMMFEGDCTNCEIPYFTGMQSVKMPVLTTVGKNLFDINKFKSIGIDEQGYYIPRKFVDNADAKATLKLKPNTKYVVTGTYIYTGKARFIFRINDGAYQNMNDAFETDATGVVNIKIGSNNVDVSDPSKMEKIMIVESTLKDIYEPFKSNILTCNEEVELRKVGDVQDELDLLTGELTQRIQERVFDGSENWIIGGTGDNYIMFRCENYTDMVKSSNVITCDKYTYNKVNNALSNLSVTNSTTTGKICILTSQTDLSIDNFKAKLNIDKPTIQYQLAEPIVKTVDLSVVNQDGKKTKLSTFDDITHVTVSSEGLVPTGDIDIARPIQFVDYSLDNSLTTLYNTLEYPVKSAVLKGQTLKNITNYNIKANSNVTIEADGTITITAKGTYTEVFLPALEKLPSTKYWVGINVIENTLNGDFVFHATTGVNCIFAYSATITQGFVGVKEQVRTTMADVSSAVYAFRSYLGSKVTEGSIKYKVMVIPYQEGMENWGIPYFTGMQSVKMPVLTTNTSNLIPPFTEWEILSGEPSDYSISEKRVEIKLSRWNMGVMIKKQLKPNTMYTVGWDEMSFNLFNFAGTTTAGDKTPFNTFTTDDSGMVTFRLKNSTSSGTFIIDGFRINEGNVDFGYTPFKTNILTCNEEVTLRGVGDIKDELNLTTGELTQRIGEVVLDGSSDELWDIDTNGSGFKRFVSRVKKTHSNYSEITNWLPTANKTYWSINENGFYIGSNGEPVIVFNTNDSRYNMSITEFKNYLSQNPLIVQYPLAEETIKTVTLSIVDQDENALLITENGEYIITENGNYINVSTKSKETELSTFDDITHVTVSSEGLVPTGEITVATKNSTDVVDASVMSLRMDDILNSQETLEGSANTQSDDIDVAMLGTTDIYEQLL